MAEPAALYGGGFAGELALADVEAVRALPRLADSRCERSRTSSDISALDMRRDMGLHPTAI